MKRKMIRSALAVALALSLAVPVFSPAIAPAGEVNAAKKTDKTVSRAQVIKQIWKLAGKPDMSGTILAKDVKKTANYYKATRWAVRSGILKNKTKLEMTKAVTRQELAGYFWAYSGSPNSDSWKGYSDEKKVSKSLVTATRWAKANNVLKGVASKKLSPKSKVYSKELTKVLSNYKKNEAKKPLSVSTGDLYLGASGIMVDKFGALLVTDTFNKQIWRIVNGEVKLYAGKETISDIYGEPIGGNNDGLTTEALFKSPWAITPFRDGYAVSDALNGSLRLVNSKGVKTINGSSSEGLKTNKNGVEYAYPTGLATDDSGSLYIADTLNNAIRRMTSEGDVTTFASELTEPMGLAYYNGYIYVAETGAHRIIRINTTTRTKEIIAGSGEEGLTDGDALAAEFSSPNGVTVGKDGTVYVADTVNGAVRMIKNGQVTTILDPPDGMALDTWPVSPTQLVTVGNRLYVTDSFAKRIYALNIG